ncbi:MupA/Atu3671 family FMN-dependent luciferase-like monooxygenase [Actinacidiphila guanduensis]|uniref:Natural product biosynthesis luciferase-like monooxygenase domain-containing protein n=1 Tax=Actinacidiphila guanduensis TaxID=310781 RepID=A0A1H0BNK4_9ACTN|nr:MupA/Atu3671 family FMN-dependent luciferase-like monooxygenase [Actinacidiphila guanduensis]SDN47230.1 natural product biosynthesis luciferase-like monooxygenase domain-containing protein [Actinacidiphila guanduensis]
MDLSLFFFADSSQGAGAGGGAEGAVAAGAAVDAGGSGASGSAPAAPAVVPQEEPAGRDRYRLLLDSARFADAHGFTAVWTPERHFHRFGGQYPNPALTGAALAAVTERIGIRAGSVVAPLHHPIRIAEEWAVVDNLSGGRAGISVASGWHARDFVLRPENFKDRRDIMVETATAVQRLWRGEEVEFEGAEGERRGVRLYPRPVQRELPLWITAAGSPQSFRVAGRLGAGVLTHRLGQADDALERNIAGYREALAAEHGPRARGHVVVMLHTLLGADRARVRALAEGPLTGYLRSSMELIAAAPSADGFSLDRMSADDRDFMVARQFDRLFTRAGLFGTVADAVPVVARLAAMGVDEIACLIDFGVPPEEVLDSLHHLAALREACATA